MEITVADPPVARRGSALKLVFEVADLARTCDRWCASAPTAPLDNTGCTLGRR